jgi:hypothetical protein
MLLTGEHWTPGRVMHDPGGCRFTLGLCASVRSSLESVFSTSTDAEAFTCGSVEVGLSLGA